MNRRICPYCGYIDQRQPGQHIIAVLNDKTRDCRTGGCSCPICRGLWIEYAYRDGTTINKLVRDMQHEWRSGRLMGECNTRNMQSTTAVIPVRRA